METGYIIDYNYFNVGDCLVSQNVKDFDAFKIYKSKDALYEYLQEAPNMYILDDLYKGKVCIYKVDVTRDDDEKLFVVHLPIISIRYFHSNGVVITKKYNDIDEFLTSEA